MLVGYTTSYENLHVDHTVLGRRYGFILAKEASGFETGNNAFTSPGISTAFTFTDVDYVQNVDCFLGEFGFYAINTI